MTSSPLAPQEWNAGAYHKLSAPQFEWGQRVMDRITWRGDACVLDAGCGSGRLTAELASRVPSGCVVALDRSWNMLIEAQATLGRRDARVPNPMTTAAAPGAAGRFRVVQADLLALPFQRAFDVIFSTAVFHWVHDHDALFVQLHTALKPGGLVVAQCGGGPNIAQLHERALALARTEPYAPYFESWRSPWNYATAEDTAARLAHAGFVDVKTDLEEAPTELPDAPTFAAFLTTVILRAHLAYLPDETLRQAFIARMTEVSAADARRFFIDYWRLNLWARRPEASSGPA
jgi:trans-aconitate methyltransferase